MDPTQMPQPAMQPDQAALQNALMLQAIKSAGQNAGQPPMGTSQAMGAPPVGMAQPQAPMAQPVGMVDPSTMQGGLGNQQQMQGMGPQMMGQNMASQNVDPVTAALMSRIPGGQ